MEAKDVAKHPIMHGIPPPNPNKQFFCPKYQWYWDWKTLSEPMLLIFSPCANHSFGIRCDLDSRAPGHLARPVGSNPEGIIFWTKILVKMEIFYLFIFLVEILMHTKCTHLEGKQSESSLGFFLYTTNAHDFSGQSSCPWLPLRNIKWWVVYFYFCLYVLSLKVLKQQYSFVI